MKRINRILLLPEYFQFGGGSYTFLLKIIKIFHKLNIQIGLVIEDHKNDKILTEICFQYNVMIIVCPDRKNIFRRHYLSLFYEAYIYFKYIKKEDFDILVISNISPFLNLLYFIFNRSIIFIIHSSCHFFGCIDRCDCKKKENQTRTINVEEVP